MRSGTGLRTASAPRHGAGRSPPQGTLSSPWQSPADLLPTRPPSYPSASPIAAEMHLPSAPGTGAVATTCLDEALTAHPEKGRRSGEELRSLGMGMGLLCLGSPAIPPVFSGTFCSHSVPGPRSTTAGRISLATTESRITSHPAWQLSGLPNRCQLSPCRLPSPLISGAGGRPRRGAASTSLAACEGADTCCPCLPRGLPPRDLSCITETAPTAPEGRRVGRGNGRWLPGGAQTQAQGP